MDFARILAILTVLVGVGCGAKQTERAMSDLPAPLSPPANLGAEGTFSGGGGFGDTNANHLLSRAKEELARELRLANPVIFENMGNGWNQEKFAKMIESTRADQNYGPKRHGRFLLFDYGNGDNGPYIIATKALFEKLAAVNLSTLNAAEERKHVLDLKHQMLHEAMHHLGVGTTEATDSAAATLAALLLARMGEDFIACTSPVRNLPKQLPHFLLTNSERLELSSIWQKLELVIYINRISGRGSYGWILPDGRGFQRIDPSLSKPNLNNFVGNSVKEFIKERAVGELLTKATHPTPEIKVQTMLSLEDARRLGMLTPSMSVGADWSVDESLVFSSVAGYAREPKIAAFPPRIELNNSDFARSVKSIAAQPIAADMSLNIQKFQKDGSSPGKLDVRLKDLRPWVTRLTTSALDDLKHFRDLPDIVDGVASVSLECHEHRGAFAFGAEWSAVDSVIQQLSAQLGVPARDPVKAVQRMLAPLTEY